MSSKLTRDHLRRIILEERRAVTRQLIAEGGCGCGGCSTCASGLKKILGGSQEMEPHEDVEVITYDDDGLPHPDLYQDHATADATHAYPYEKDTGDDIVHGHEYGQSYMAKQNLHKLAKLAHQLDSMIEGDEELEDWCESKLAVAASMVQAVADFVAYHKGATMPEAESHAPDHGMMSLMRVLSEE